MPPPINPTHIPAGTVHTSSASVAPAVLAANTSSRAADPPKSSSILKNPFAAV
jgi:hypothetical protein